MNKKDFGYNTDCCCLTDREINQILMKENQDLKDRWETFKKWIADTKALRGSSTYFLQETLLEKMQELEQATNI